MKKDLDLKGYSPKTKKMYIRNVERFGKCYGRSFEQLGVTEIRNYLLSFSKQYSQSYVNNIYSALKFLYTVTLNQEWDIRKIPRAKQKRKLPVVLSKSEVK